MLYTSAEASKLLRKLTDEKEALIVNENQSKTYVVATTENEEELRPDYDYNITSAKLNEINDKILKIKHAINLFNVTHEVPETNDLTIDQVLIAMPQLNERKDKLSKMKNRLPKFRSRSNIGSNIIEYDYVNYDINQVSNDYNEICEKISKMQLELDKINNTDKMEIDI